MGLDMYLYAERRFDPHSDTGQAILSAAGHTFADLELIAKSDPQVTEQTLYLSAYGFDADEKVTTLAIFDAAEMRAFMTDDSPGGHLGAKDGSLALQVTCVYWRKANAVHSWFVDETQGGEDECEESPVEGEQLARLRALCLDALSAYGSGDIERAETIMRPKGGFFFGSTEVDEYWAEDLRHTATEIERVVNLAAQTRGAVQFSYRASW